MSFNKDSPIIHIPDWDEAGIYSITNINNGKMYIGKSKNCKTRIQQHNTNLRKRKGYPKKMQGDLENGDKFWSEILWENHHIITEYELSIKERDFIYEYNTCERGYNTQEPVLSCSLLQMPDYASLFRTLQLLSNKKPQDRTIGDIDLYNKISKEIIPSFIIPCEYNEQTNTNKMNLFSRFPVFLLRNCQNHDLDSIKSDKYLLVVNNLEEVRKVSKDVIKAKCQMTYPNLVIHDFTEVYGDIANNINIIYNRLLDEKDVTLIELAGIYTLDLHSEINCSQSLTLVS